MRVLLFTIVLLLNFFSIQAQDNFIANDLRINQYVEGTLLAPRQETVPLAIIINGSGPIDRNGNEMMTKNNSAKKLAEALAKKGIATFRYDKRTLKAQQLNIDEKDMRFDDFIDDAKAVIKRFTELPNYSSIYIIGHSQGSLVGMIAAQEKADGFISIAGAGQTIDSLIVEQIGRQMPGLEESARTAFNELRANGKVKDYNQGLASLFKKSIQPFMFSWMKYDPQQEIKKLEMPVLIINGDNDLQVNTNEAKKLKDAKPDAELVIIENMNHIYRIIDKNDDIANQKSYNEPQRPISNEMVEQISNFILN
ncbi:alpha/beta hydrolase [Mesonia mobilis]|uniref:Alpha/beta hydrolase n=1 Tax=Mesonia mobilis TaxID=369791 RepID=A0ABQ3BK69_9FLAO|nr:alpha/beta hydrolase [Mesonia mobilis]MBQ0739240.1 alpha/beta hydrolase [Aquimarina celericrescens]GGZ47985.1 alpha/beta hydrolase [Mesonia mobilis]